MIGLVALKISEMYHTGNRSVMRDIEGAKERKAGRR
jgi:hypothetical protein